MGEVKKVIVFGATGMCGIAMMRCALQEKLEVTAYVRTPSRIPSDLREKVNIVEGDVLNKEKVERAIEGHDAVLSALGRGWRLGASNLISDGCKNIIAGMKRHGVRKLAAVGILTLLPEVEQRFVYHLYDKVTADHRRQVDALKAESESIEWISVNPPRIRNNSTVNSTYMVKKDNLPGGGEVNTGEIADFMVKVLNDDERFTEYRHELIGISSRPKKKSCFP